VERVALEKEGGRRWKKERKMKEEGRGRKIRR